MLQNGKISIVPSVQMWLEIRSHVGGIVTDDKKLCNLNFYFCCCFGQNRKKYHKTWIRYTICSFNDENFKNSIQNFSNKNQKRNSFFLFFFFSIYANLASSDLKHIREVPIKMTNKSSSCCNSRSRIHIGTTNLFWTNYIITNFIAARIL